MSIYVIHVGCVSTRWVTAIKRHIKYLERYLSHIQQELLLQLISVSNFDWDLCVCSALLITNLCFTDKVLFLSQSLLVVGLKWRNSGTRQLVTFHVSCHSYFKHWFLCQIFIEMHMYVTRVADLLPSADAMELHLTLDYTIVPDFANEEEGEQGFALLLEGEGFIKENISLDLIGTRLCKLEGGRMSCPVYRQEGMLKP